MTKCHAHAVTNSALRHFCVREMSNIYAEAISIAAWPLRDPLTMWRVSYVTEDDTLSWAIQPVFPSNQRSSVVLLVAVQNATDRVSRSACPCFMQLQKKFATRVRFDGILSSWITESLPWLLGDWITHLRARSLAHNNSQMTVLWRNCTARLAPFKRRPRKGRKHRHVGAPFRAGERWLSVAISDVKSISPLSLEQAEKTNKKS